MTPEQRSAAADHFSALCHRLRELEGPPEAEMLLTAAAYALEGEAGPSRARMIVETLDVIRERFAKEAERAHHLQEHAR